MSLIHPSSVISDEAVIGDNVKIGPFSVISGKVKIGDGTIIENSVSIGCTHGVVDIGKENHFLPGAVVGGPPQDLTYKNEPTRLEMGDRNTIREFTTINNGTVKGGSLTTVGSDNLLMAYVHIAHDCILGNHIVIANNTHFAGHVTVEDRVVIGGGGLINQFAKIGKAAYIAGDSSINKDILPFTTAQGKYAVMRATNRVGIERAGYSKEEREAINKAVRYIIKGSGTMEEIFERIDSDCGDFAGVKELVDFAKSSTRGLARSL